ncbi:MAG: hypothetical protein WB777_09820 [Mycobacterium sp.]
MVQVENEELLLYGTGPVVGAERLREIVSALIDRAAVVVQRSEGRVGESTGDGIMVVLNGRP